jgi:hypothetical protein
MATKHSTPKSDKPPPSKTLTTIDPKASPNAGKATLLALPQEIRDEIFSHLHYKISVELKRTLTRTSYLAFNVYVVKSPFPAVFLTCKQFNREYKEMSFVKEINTTMVIGQPFHVLLP